MENLGILTAVGAALAWGSYIVPFKISRSSNLIQFQALMGVGIFISGLIFSLLLGYSFNLNLYGLFSGSLWAIANAISLVAIFNIGISRAVPVIASLVILSTFLWGALVFGELPGGLFWGFVGIGLIILGVSLVSTTGNTTSQNVKKGLTAGILAGLLFGSQLVPLKMDDLQVSESFFPMSLGIFLTALIITLISKARLKKEALKESLLSGTIWNIGNLLSLWAISLIGLSKAIPVSQSSTLIAVLWGLFYFKEITGRKNRLQVLFGAVILLMGVMVLSLA